LKLKNKNRGIKMSSIAQTVQDSTTDQDTASKIDWATSLPDHTQLPDKNGDFVKNCQEPPQGDLLTNCITPVLQKLHPDGNFCIARDCGIYWRLPEPPESPEKGAVAPDWFYVPNVPTTLDDQVRRSFVMWKETIEPLIAIEFVSGSGAEERDRTPVKGKFWIYERAIQIPFYGIYEVNKAKIEVYELINRRYQKMKPNSRGHYPIEPLQVELGIWQGEYQNQQWPWLRWWDSDGKLLLTAEERVDRLAEQLRALGVEPEG
jgi:Uma2 family endonuclease